MDTIIRRKAQLSVAAVAALAIFAVAAVMLLAGGFAAGSAQAQAGPGETPKLCGPGQSLDNYPDEPAEVKSQGHYALFDAYWLPAEGLGDDANDGTLNNNLCPPAAQHSEKMSRGKTVEVTTLSSTDIDLRSTIIQVGNQHLADVVAKNAQAGTTKLSLQKYEGVARALGLGENVDTVPDGTPQVYWLRLEDGNIPASNLVLGFSAGHLSENHWRHDNAEGTQISENAFQYELEAVRYHGPHASKLPQVLTYWEPELGSGLVWNSLDTDVNSMPLGAGEYEHLEWVFTHPGTYVLEVHLKGHVRQSKPDGAGADWAKITEKDTTVTSEVREYTFQVGPLTVNDSPAFGVMRSVEENSAGGTKVGDPIKVFTNDNDALTYSLAGVGADKFNTDSVAGGAQITVADGAALDYEGKRTYDLVLSVSDGKDHENNPERVSTVDDTIVVQITLVDVPPSIALNVPTADPRVGDSVTIRASYLELQGYVPASADWSIRFLDANGNTVRTAFMTFEPDGHGEYTLTATGAGTQKYQVLLEYDIRGRYNYPVNQSLTADFSINWLPASP